MTQPERRAEMARRRELRREVERLRTMVRAAVSSSPGTSAGTARGTNSSPVIPCREARPELRAAIDGSRVRWAPLRFECTLTGGGSFATAVPGWVNPRGQR